MHMYVYNTYNTYNTYTYVLYVHIRYLIVLGIWYQVCILDISTTIFYCRVVEL